jgi:DNA-binding NarL/FixJ family response regulator
MRKSESLPILWRAGCELPNTEARGVLIDRRHYTVVAQAMNTDSLPPASETIRVLIVEYLFALREGLRMRLAAETDISVVDQVADCESALELLASLCPDLVLVDAEGPDMDWTAPEGAPRSICRKAAVIVLSLYDDAITQARVENAGASAFVTKSSSSDMLLTTIREVYGTRPYKRAGEDGKTQSSAAATRRC